MFHVHADLMCTACFQNAFRHGNISQFLYHAVIGGSVFPFGAVGEHRHLQPVLRIPADITFDSAVFRRGNSPHYGHIFASGCFLEKLFAEKCLGIRILGHNQKSGCVFVYAVYESQAGIVNIVIGIVSKMPCECVDKGAAVISMSGMHNETWLLIDNEYVFILINYIQGDILWYNLEVVSGAVHDHTDHIEGLYPIIAFYRLAVYENASRFGGLLYTVAGRSLEPLN